MKVFQSELSEYRKYKFEQQKGLCGLCKLPMNIAECVVDHDHVTGKIRSILHTGCNAFEGKIKYSFTRYIGKSKGLHLSELLVNLANYLVSDYSDNPYHPSTLDPNELELKVITKKLKSLKSKSHIDQYKARAVELRKLIKQNKLESKWTQ